MSKLVSLSDEAYTRLKKLKGDSKSFSQVIVMLLGERKKKNDIDQLFAILGHDKNRAKKWKEKVRYDRDNNWEIK